MYKEKEESSERRLKEDEKKSKRNLGKVEEKAAVERSPKKRLRKMRRRSRLDRSQEKSRRAKLPRNYCEQRVSYGQYCKPVLINALYRPMHELCWPIAQCQNISRNSPILHDIITCLNLHQ